MNAIPEQTSPAPRHAQIGNTPGSGGGAQLRGRMRELATPRKRWFAAPRHRQSSRVPREPTASGNFSRDRLAGGPIGFVGLLSPEGRLLDADHGALEAADLGVVGAVGSLFWDTSWWSWSPAVQERLRDAVTRAAGGDVIRYDDTIRVSGNRLITIGVSLVPRIDVGAVIALVGSAVDMTSPPGKDSAVTVLSDDGDPLTRHSGGVPSWC